ncbi:MAG: alkaline phosphatase family protein, partial [Terracidiphilus sp.]
PGYLGNGSVAPTSGADGDPFTIPPTSVPSIGDSLIAANIPFKYYGEGWDLYVADPTGTNPFDVYCNICNPFGYQTSIMASPAMIEDHIADTSELYEDIDSGTLPPVSIVKPSGYNDGHPASSKLDLFEGFVKKIIDEVQANPKLWATTAIFITEDEGGGYYDSGYIQPVDFFGDGTRIPLIVVSPYSEGGIVTHEYGDHVSLIKFIEKNWGLKPISDRSRDNLPNPKYAKGNAYVPTNSPALDDLTSEFTF